MRKFLSLLFACTICAMSFTSCENANGDGQRIAIKKDQKIYLNSDSTAYTRGDTITLDGRKFIKVWGITHCKYGCPVLIECK